MYLCESVKPEVIDVTGTSTAYNVTWILTSASGNIEVVISGLLTLGFPIPAMSLLQNTQYTLTAVVNDECTYKIKTATIQTAGYPISSITSPTSAVFLSWWEDEGTLLGCAACSAASANAVPTCQTCSTPLQMNAEGRCVCSDQNSYIDLASFPTVSCQSKSNSVAAWSLQQASPNIQMQMSFDNGFAFNEAHLSYTATIFGVSAATAGYTIQDYSATSNNPNITLSFKIPQDRNSEVTIELTDLSEYNLLSYSPFLIQNPDLTYLLPEVTYPSPETEPSNEPVPDTKNDTKPYTNDAIVAVGDATKVAMTAQVVTSAIMPAVTGGVSTFAMLLLAFLAEIDIYMYLNVPTPDNFNLFCEQITTDMFPNVFANMDDNPEENPTSTIGKFEFWEISATLLDNCFVNIFKELLALGIIVATNILMLIFSKCGGFYSLIGNVRDLFMWNVFLSFYVGDYAELQLNSMIELREHSVSSSYSKFSLAIAIIIIISYACLAIYFLFALNRKRRNRNAVLPVVDDKPNQPTDQESFWPVPPRVALISEDFTDSNAFTRNFFLVMMAVDFLMILLVFFFQNYGLAQAIIYTILTIGYVAIIAWQRPFKSPFKLIVMLLNQSSKAIMGIIAVVFGINEKTNSIPEDSINRMGTFLIVLIVTVIAINLVVAVLITAVETFNKIRELVRQVRPYLSKKLKSKIFPKKSKAKARQQNQVEENQNWSSVKSINLQPLSNSGAVSPSNSEVASPNYSEDSNFSERVKNNLKREKITRVIDLRTIKSNTSNATDAKNTISYQDSIESSPDQSLTKFIFPVRLKHRDSSRDEGLDRIRGLGESRQDQDQMESMEKMESIEKIDLPFENFLK